MPQPVTNRFKKFDYMVNDAMGQITSVSEHLDGTMIIGTDTQGAYIGNAARTAWSFITTDSSLPSDGVPIHHGYDNYGCYDLASAPSNSSIIWMMLPIGAMRSADKGQTFAKVPVMNGATPFTSIELYSRFNPNGVLTKLYGPKLVIDPSNPEVVYLGGQTANSGLYRRNGPGQNFVACTVPQPTASLGSGQLAYGAIAVDGASGNVSTAGIANSNRKAVVYAGVGSRGLCKSSNGGDTFALISGGALGGPTAEITCICIVSASVMLVIENQSRLWKLNRALEGQANAWTEITGPTGPIPIMSNRQLLWIDANPFRANEWLLTSGGGEFACSINGGVTWTDHDWNRKRHFDCSDVPLMGFRAYNDDAPVWPPGQTNPYFLSAAKTVFSRINDREVLVCHGVGMFRFQFPATGLGATIDFTSFSKGIKQLVGQHTAQSPNGKRFVLGHDAAVMPVASPRIAPSVYYGNRGAIIRHGQMMNFWENSDGTVVAAFASKWGVGNQPGGTEFSLDGGDTWNLFPTYPDIVNYPNFISQQNKGAPYVMMSGGDGGGEIYPMSNDVFLWVPSGNYAPGQPKRTTNQGQTWQDMNFPVFYGNSNNNYVQRIKQIAVDPFTPGRALWFNGYVGFAVTTDYGATWTKVDTKVNGSSKITSPTGSIYPNSPPNQRGPIDFPEYHGGVLYVPRIKGCTNRVGHVVHYSGDQGPDTGIGEPLFFSSTNAADWRVVPGVNEVKTCCFGKNYDGVDYPAFYFLGFLDGVMGLYGCPDISNTNPSFYKLNDGAVLNSRDGIWGLSASALYLERLMFGLNGSGYGYTNGNAPGTDRITLRAA